jgi:hypothetical protein
MAKATDLPMKLTGPGDEADADPPTETASLNAIAAINAQGHRHYRLGRRHGPGG